MHEALWYSLSIGFFDCRFDYLLNPVDVFGFELPCFVMFEGDLFEMCDSAELMMTHLNYNLL